MKLPFCRAALLAAALGVCLVGCKPAATDEPAASATAETAEAAATLTPTAATTAQPVAAEIGTVLPATEDAGRSYLDETLFIGDSNTVRYTMYADETGTAFASVDNSIGVVSMGAGAITTLKCEKFKGSSTMYTVPEAVAMLKPQRIIICYGTNNLGGSSTDATSYIKTYLQGLPGHPDCVALLRYHRQCHPAAGQTAREHQPDHDPGGRLQCRTGDNVRGKRL